MSRLSYALCCLGHIEGETGAIYTSEMSRLSYALCYLGHIEGETGAIYTSEMSRLSYALCCSGHIEGETGAIYTSEMSRLGLGWVLDVVFLHWLSLDRCELCSARLRSWAAKHGSVPLGIIGRHFRI